MHPSVCECARSPRWFLTANGLLVPFLVFQMYVRPLIWIAAAWAVTFPGATCALARWFRRADAISRERAAAAA